MKFAAITAGSVGLLIVIVVLALCVPVSERMTAALVEARTNEMASISKEVAEQFVDYFTEATRAAEMMEHFWENALEAAPDRPMHYLIDTYSLAIFNFLRTRKGLGACYISMEREHVAEGQDCDVDAMLLSTTFRAVFTNETTGNYTSCPNHVDDPEGFARHPQRSCKGFARLCALRGAKDLGNPLTPVARIFDQPCSRWILGSTRSLNSKGLSRDAGPDPAHPKHNLQGPSWAWSWPFVAGANSKSQAVKHGSFRPLRPTGRETKMMPLAFCDLTMSKSTVNQEGFQSLGDILTSAVANVEGKSTGTVLFVLSHKQEFVASSLPDVVPERVEGSTTEPTQASITGLKRYDNETLPEAVRAVGAWVMDRSCPEGVIPCDFDTLPAEGRVAGHYLALRPLHDPLAAQLGMLLIMMVPEDEIKQPARDAQEELIIISVCVFAGAVLVAVAFGLAVSMPISSVRGLLLGAAALEDLHEIVEQTHKKSVVGEIADMQGSVRVLVKALIMYKGFLPQNIVDNDESDVEIAVASADFSVDSKASPAGKASGQVSGRVSTTRGSRHSSAASHTAEAMLKLAGDRTSISSLSRKRVSFVAVNIKGWHRQASELSDAKLLSAHGAYIAQCLKVFQGQRGITDAFSGDKLVCSFNAAKTVSGHRVSACEALVQIRDAVSPGLGLEMSSAAACGEARVGNMGCDTMRKFSFVSPVLAWVRVLERYSSAMGVSCLVDDLVGEETRGQYTQMLVDEVLFTKRSGRPLRVNALGGKIEVEEGEWMYQLEEAGNRTDPHKLWNEYAVMIMAGEFDRALEVAPRVSEDAPSAAVRARMEAAVEARAFAPTEIAWH